MLTDSRSQLDAPWVAIQRNRTSGAGRQFPPLVDLIRGLRQHGFIPRLFANRAHLDAAIASHRDTLIGIVAAGGDGTVLDLINRHPEVPIAVLPMGTENLLARYLGIPRRGGSFVARMIATGHTDRFDVGTINHSRFLIMASCGIDAAIIHHAHLARRGHITRRHYWTPILHTLQTWSYRPLRLFIDGTSQPIEGRLAIVANVPRYALHLPVTSRASPQDGQLDVRVFRHQSPFQLARDLTNVLLRGDREWSGVVHRLASRIRIESDQPLPVQADGDPAGTTPCDIGIDPAAARLFVPQVRAPS